MCRCSDLDPYGSQALSLCNGLWLPNSCRGVPMPRKGTDCAGSAARLGDPAAAVGVLRLDVAGLGQLLCAVERIAAALANGIGIERDGRGSGWGRWRVGWTCRGRERCVLRSELALDRHRIERVRRSRGEGGGVATVRRGNRLAAEVGEAEGARAARCTMEAVEAMRPDGAEVVEARGPVGMDLHGVVMRRQADGRIDVARQGGARDLHRPVPEIARGLAGERAVAGERKLAAAGAFRSFVDHAANGAGIGRVGHPVKHDLRDGALAGFGLACGFIVYGCGHALQGAGAVDAAGIDVERAGKGPGSARRCRSIPGIGMHAFACLQGRGFLFEIVEGGARKARSGALEGHRLEGLRLGRGIGDGEAAPVSRRSEGGQGDRGKAGKACRPAPLQMGAVGVAVPAPALEPGREVARGRLAFADRGNQGRWLGQSVPFGRRVSVHRRRILRLTRFAIWRIRPVTAVPKRYTAPFYP
ncbi:hypothetical protein SPHV1_270011 [Novosphingobium sp. KN65.2]|nr:hypothetical protein SPHV1_270011 [Novosphingobium sp. KN65.2]